MPHREHSTIGEGLLTGLIGGVVVALWYLAIDVGRGEPLHTPSVLGQVFVGTDTMPTARVVSSAVLQYSLLHFGVFFLLGVILVGLAHMATREPTLRMGVWFALVISFLGFLGFLFTLYSVTDQRFPWWQALGGSILGIGSMALFLWRRHPALRGTFDEASLGDEVETPLHPSERSGRR